MAQYKPFADGVEVNGQTILTFVAAIPAYKDVMFGILAKHELKTIEPDGWYSQQRWLNAFQEIGERYGANTLYAIGKQIPENAKFPPEINDLEKALSAIDIAYQMNHQNGEIGYYKLVDFDGTYRRAVMECKNPYPSHFDRGIITSMTRKFRPVESIVINVILDENKPSRLNGAESCTYKVEW
ncbi:MAG: hypothetical protein CMO01_29360 [Thalassobius sp.]|nr:hypothetical protein [Thalassovita sp.]